MNRWIFLSLAAAAALTGCSVSGQFYSNGKARPPSEAAPSPSHYDRLPAILERCRSAKAEIFEGLPHPMHWKESRIG